MLLAQKLGCFFGDHMENSVSALLNCSFCIIHTPSFWGFLGLQLLLASPSSLSHGRPPCVPLSSYIGAHPTLHFNASANYICKTLLPDKVTF